MLLTGTMYMMRGIALICRAALIFVFFCLCIFLFPQDVENISPVADKITRRDVEKLPMDELRKRANTLTQKLE